jgi:hypothetical protein
MQKKYVMIAPGFIKFAPKDSKKYVINQVPLSEMIFIAMHKSMHHLFFLKFCLHFIFEFSFSTC